MYDYTWVFGVALLASVPALLIYAHRQANRKDNDRG